MKKGKEKKRIHRMSRRKHKRPGENKVSARGRTAERERRESDGRR